MGEKLDLYRSYGQKLISLFVRLLFTGERHSLTELSLALDCSKQTIIRLVNDIHKAYRIDIEETFKGNKKFYRMKRPAKTMPQAPLTGTEIRTLQMCRDFTEHLLGKELYEEATRALLKSLALLPDTDKTYSRHFAAFRPGSIDYTPYGKTIKTLIDAMDKKIVCQLSYQGLTEKKPKTFFIKPLKLFSHRETVYLHAQLARTPGKRYRSPKYDPLLAVHRMKQVELTDRYFEGPDDFDFEKAFNRQFGIMKDETFTVEAAFTGWSASFVAERIWSPDQQITKNDDGTIILAFTASSEPELIAWLLSFGEEARLISPDWLVKDVKLQINKMKKLYAGKAIS